MLGQYALALAITAPVFMFSNMRVRFVVATDVYAETPFADYFTFRVMSSALATVLIVAATSVVTAYRDVVLFLLAMCLVRTVESLSDVVYGLYQRHHRLHLMAVSMTIAGAAMLLAIVVGLLTNKGLDVILWWMLLGRIAVFVLFDLPQWLYRWPDTASESSDSDTWVRTLLALLYRCWPLGLVALLVSLNTNIPRYFVEYMLGSEMLGIFAALAYVPIAGYMIVGTIGQTMMPQVAKAFHDGDIAGVTRGTLTLCGFGAVSGLLAIGVGWLIGDEFLRIAYGEVYSSYGALFLLLLLAGAISYVVVGAIYVLTAAGRYSSQLLVYSADLVAITSMCLILIPRLGIGGTAYAMIASQVLQLSIVASLIFLVLRDLGAVARTTSVASAEDQ